MPTPRRSIAVIQRPFPRIVLTSLWFGLLSLPLMMELKAPFFGLGRPLLVSAGVAAAVVIPLGLNRYHIDILTQVGIYVTLALGLNIVVGLAGLLDLGYVAFYAVGAYTYGLLSTRVGLSFWEVLPLGGLLAAIFGILLG